MSFLEIAPMLQIAFALVSKIIKNINEKKKDDGKISNEEALEIISNIIPDLFSILTPFVKEK
jgi:hypothetical protein